MIPTFLRSLAALIRQFIANGKAVHVTERTAAELELLAGLPWPHGCECEPDAEPDEPGEPRTHYVRTCAACDGQWEALHCPHDGVQNPCPACGRRPAELKEIQPADLARGWLLASKARPPGDNLDTQGALAALDRAAACAELAYLCCAFGWEEHDPAKPDTWAQHTVYAHRGTREGARAAWGFIVELLPTSIMWIDIPLYEDLLKTYRRELEAMK